ncbi:MAG: hypothetical protein QOH36_36 [Actinomycetota bacterium]|nr:hypothetical protein [Actinomycetota bacterium]
MGVSVIDDSVLSLFPAEKLTGNEFFPWYNFSGFLTEDGYRELSDHFPSPAIFEKHTGLKRPDGQRPQNRYYLALDQSIYADREGLGGSIRREELNPAWGRFIDELEGDDYRAFIKRTLDLSDFVVRFAWHLGHTGSEVCPHLDVPQKLATHIFYFNEEGDWNPSWGGSTLVLGQKTTTAKNPEFEDFGASVAVRTIGNSSFLFKNTPAAWHGVRPLTCPEGAYRRLFNVILERKPSPLGKAWQRLRKASA